jgi:hypothetical protein
MDPGTVNEDVDAAPFPDLALDKLGDLLVDAQIDDVLGNGDSVPTRLLGDLLEPRSIAADQQDVGALGGERTGERPANAATGAGDESTLTGKCSLHAGELY